MLSAIQSPTLEFEPPNRTALGGSHAYTTDGVYSIHETGSYGRKVFTVWWHRCPIRDRDGHRFTDRRLSTHRLRERAVKSCERHARQEVKNPTQPPRVRKRVAK